MLSAGDIETYRTCPLKYKFARVFRIPSEPTINQRFGILVHQVLERFHAGGTVSRSLPELLGLLEAGWRRGGFGDSEEERQLRTKATNSLIRYHERFQGEDAEPVWFERAFQFKMGPHLLRGRVDRVDRLPDGGYELIDYKTGRPKTAAQLREDVQLSLYAVGARESWQLEAAQQAYYYVLDDEKVPVERSEEDRDWITDTVLEVADGIQGQGFEPTPSYAACSMCDYRIACPAAAVAATRAPLMRGVERRRGWPQEALELARQQVARRELGGVGRGLLLVGGALEPLDEGLHVRVHLDGARDLALVVDGGRLELGGVDVHADQRLELAQQRERALRVRHDRDVVRDRGPQRGGGDPGVGRGGLEAADDAGRALVGRRAEADAVDERLVGGDAGDGDGARVRDVGEQRAERGHHLHAERLGEVDDRLAERAPADRGLGAGEQDQVARRARDAGLVDLELGPVDVARQTFVQAHRRAGRLEVDELLGIDGREALGVERRAEKRQGGCGGLARIVPALECANQSRGPQAIRATLPT